MADSKISALTDGTTPASTDAAPFARSGGTTVKLTWAEMKAAIFSTQTIAASGTSQTISYASGATAKVTLTGNCTFTLSGAVTGMLSELTLILVQDATGGRTVSWPGSVTWLNGTAPVLHTGAAAIDIVTLISIDGGTTWLGAAANGAPQLGYLGSAQITGVFSTTNLTATQVTGLASTVTVPGGTHIKLTVSGQSIYNSTTADYAVLTIWDGAVGSGTLIATSASMQNFTTGSPLAPFTIIGIVNPSAGSKTYNVGLHALVGGTANISGATGSPTLLLVESI